MMNSSQKLLEKWKRQNGCIMEDILRHGLLARNKDTFLRKKKYPPGQGRTTELFLPLVKVKQLCPQAVRCPISQSCPALHGGHSCSMSSVISQRDVQTYRKQEHHRGLQKTYKQSNVTITMTYLGLVAKSRDYLKVLQQISGGENICVFRGHLHPGEQFQFVSRRHWSFPFSVSLFVNGMMAARISSCCEYRYRPGFQQGSRSCFRLTRLSGGMACYRCASIHYKKCKRPHLYDGVKEKFLVSAVGKPAKGEEESCPSSPLFIPIGKETPSLGLSSKDSKDVSSMLSDSDGQSSHVKVNRGRKERKKRHRRARKRSDMEEHLTGDHIMAEKEQDAHIKKSRHVMSNQKETCQSDQGTRMRGEEGHEHWEKASVDYLCGDSSPSEVELSDEVDLSLGREEEAGHARVTNGAVSTFGSSRLRCSNSSSLNRLYTGCKEMTIKPTSQEVSDNEHHLETQVEAMISKLKSCDLVEQVVLRNTGLTDELLSGLVTALKNSPSEVTLINLNLNNIGPPGVQILLDLIQLKPQVKGLLLFGNLLGDRGVCTLLRGLADLQGQTLGQRTLQLGSGDGISTNTPQLQRGTSRNSTPLHTHMAQAFVLLELDLGGNGVSGEGLRVLASYLRCHSQLKYLGLAKTNVTDISAWENLFDSLKSNPGLNHIILDECHLGDQGVKLFAKMLRYNQSLTKIDLDYNSFGDSGGNAIIEALFGRKCISHLSLEGNDMSFALMNKIQQKIQLNLLKIY